MFITEKHIRINHNICYGLTVFTYFGRVILRTYTDRFVERVMMDKNYAEILEQLGVIDLIKLDGNKDAVLISNLLKSVFYSSVNNGNSFENEELIVNGSLINKDGRLPDYLQIINLKSVIDIFSSINWGEVNVDHIENVRKALLNGVYSNGKYLDGIRRYRTSVGPYFSSPRETLKEDFDDAAGMLSRCFDSPIMNLLHAVDFKLKFIYLHPFEDGDGRTGRLMTNYYLINNGIKPMHISSDTDGFWPESLNAFHIAGSTGPYLVSALIQIIGHDNAQALAEKVKKLDAIDGYSLALKANILVQTGNTTPQEINGDISRLYSIGRGNFELVSNALWLASVTKSDSDAIIDAYSDPDPRIRAFSIYTMGKANFKKYRKDIISAASSDSNEQARMVAVVEIGLNGSMTSELALELLKNEHSEIVMIAIARYAASAKDGSGMDSVVNFLVETGDYDLKVRSYRIMMRYYDDGIVADIIRNRLLLEHDDLRKGAVIELNRSNRINDEKIAAALCDIAVKDKLVRESVLGELIGNDNVNSIYDPLLKRIVKDDLTYKCTNFEKSYAIYILGRAHGYDYIKSEFDMDESKLSNQEKIAVTLVKFNDFEKGAYSAAKLAETLEEKDIDLLFVNTTEISRIIREGCGLKLNGSTARFLEGIKNAELYLASRTETGKETIHVTKILDSIRSSIAEIHRVAVENNQHGNSALKAEFRRDSKDPSISRRLVK
ncbi:MAG: Fic family protein [Candidatus Micrarchaeaceae archaeon]